MAHGRGYAPQMGLRILPLLVLLFASVVGPAQARTATARIALVDTAVAKLHDVQVRLDWPDAAGTGRLEITARRAEAPDLGYRFADLAWSCPLSRGSDVGWRCAGALHAGSAPPLLLEVDLSDAFTMAALSNADGARLTLGHHLEAPDDIGIELEQVPLVWAQALLEQAWAAGHMRSGHMDGRINVYAADDLPLHVAARIDLRDGALESQDGATAVADLDATLRIDYRRAGQATALGVDGSLRGGELLFGEAYVALPDAPVEVGIEALSAASDSGWTLPRIEWRDGEALTARASAAIDRDGMLGRLDLDLHSGDTSVLPGRYLSGWLSRLGSLGDLGMQGALQAQARLAAGALHSASVQLDDVDIWDGLGRFRFDGLTGALRLSGSAEADSELRWRGGALRGVAFGPARLPLRSARGALQLREPVAVGLLGGQLHFDGLNLRLPADGEGLRASFGLGVTALELGRLAAAFGWPEFGGTLNGEIPDARYEDGRLDFNGGLTLRLFGGRIDVTSLALERPFGVAPALSADLLLRDLDLMAITGVFDVGSISGRLQGRVDGLRLIDWQPAAFDAWLETVPVRGVTQRISQRAVQDISSVGDASFMGSLQGRLIGLFDDFGYARIGIGCRLRGEVCRMQGLRDSGAGFIIVEGSGLPRLQVVGYNRDAHWPTLVERLLAVAGGDVAPVVE